MKLVLRYSRFPSKVIMIINVILMFNVSIIGMFAYNEKTSNDNIIINGNIFDVVEKHGRILGIVIFIFNITFKMLAMF